MENKKGSRRGRRTPSRQIQSTPENASLSPDPVELVRKMEADEMMARRLQDQFDAEVHHPSASPFSFDESGWAARPHSVTDYSRAYQSLEASGWTAHRRLVEREVDTSLSLDAGEWAAHRLDSSGAEVDSPSASSPFDPSGWTTRHPAGVSGDPYLSLDESRWAERRLDSAEVDSSSASSSSNESGLPTVPDRAPHYDDDDDDDDDDEYEDDEGDDFEDDDDDGGGEVMQRGLHKSDFTRLPTRKYTARKSSAGSSQPKSKRKRTALNKECQVCLSDFKERDNLRILPCFHEFHTPCIDPWLTINATCPVCRLRVNLDS